MICVASHTPELESKASCVTLAANKVHKMVKFCVMAGAGLEFSLQAALTGAG